MAKALPDLCGNGKILGGIPHLRHHHDDGLNTDGAGKPAKTVIGLIIRGLSLTTNLVQKLALGSHYTGKEVGNLTVQVFVSTLCYV